VVGGGDVVLERAADSPVFVVVSSRKRATTA